MAVRDWHPGQLALVWMFSLVGGSLLLAAHDDIPATQTVTVEVPGAYDTMLFQRESLSPLLRPYVPSDTLIRQRVADVVERHPVGDFLRAVVPWLVVVILPGMLFVITWRWFGGRQTRGDA